MKDSKQELIIKEIKTNRELLKELTSKVEILLPMNKLKKKQKTPQSKPIKKETKKTKTISEVSKKLNLKKKEDLSIEELIASLNVNKEKPKPKVKTPLPSS